MPPKVNPRKSAAPEPAPVAPQAPGEGFEGLEPIDLAKWGVTEVARSGYALWRKPLSYRRSLELSNTLAKLVGRDLAYGIAEASRGSEDERAEIISGIARSASEIVGQLADVDWDEWTRYLFGVGPEAVLYYQHVGPGAPPLPVIQGPGPEDDIREVVFARAPLESLAVCACLIAEGVGPLPRLGWLLGAGRPG